jgi:hypothetical protein
MSKGLSDISSAPKIEQMAVQALDAALRQNQGTVLFHACCLDIALAKKLTPFLT